MQAAATSPEDLLGVLARLLSRRRRNSSVNGQVLLAPAAGSRHDGGIYFPAFPASPNFWTLPRIPFTDTDGSMAQTVAAPDCPTCKQRYTVEIYRKHIYPQNPAVWPGELVGIHRTYQCKCGQKFTKKLKRRGGSAGS